MKEFEFLEEHPFFDKTLVIDDRKYYDFVNKNYDEVAYISVPIETGENLEWMYCEGKKGENMIFETNGGVETIENRSPWLYELVRKATASLEKRDRIRNLFTKG